MNRRQTASVMIEYLMLAGVNDSQADACELVAWLAGLRVHVNLIPYNPIEHAPNTSPQRKQVNPRVAIFISSSKLAAAPLERRSLAGASGL
ncbi:MAG TPA: hypothetical protein VMM76_16635 [Pirellulaceae bacterium]|nr:hypothetical protein [Pirellulaceae bacterium]